MFLDLDRFKAVKKRMQAIKFAGIGGLMKKGGKGGKLAALTGELISVVATGDATVAVSIKL